MKKVNILGTEYNLVEDDSLVKLNIDGMCKEYTKEISIRPTLDMLCEDD